MKLDVWLMINVRLMGSSAGAIVTAAHGESDIHCTRRCPSQWVTQTSVLGRHMLCNPQYFWRMDVRGLCETSPERSGLPTDAVWVVVAQVSAVCSPELCAVKRKYRIAVTKEEPRHEACAENLQGEKGALAMASLVLSHMEVALKGSQEFPCRAEYVGSCEWGSSVCSQSKSLRTVVVGVIVVGTYRLCRGEFEALDSLPSELVSVLQNLPLRAEA